MNDILDIEKSVREGDFKVAYDLLSKHETYSASEYYLLGRCYNHHFNDIKKAIYYYSKAVDKGIDSLDCFLFRAHAYYQLDDTINSIADIKYALSKAPGHEWATQLLLKTSRKIIAQHTNEQDITRKVLNTLIDTFSSEIAQVNQKKLLQEQVQDHLHNTIGKLNVANIEEKVNSACELLNKNIRLTLKNINYHYDIDKNDWSFLDMSSPPLVLISDCKVALDSADHLTPRGTITDNSRHPQFIRACQRLFPDKELIHMDLGCAGGGLVYDFLQAGHQSIGLEGSTAPKQAMHGYWPLIPKYLKTCDITKPFSVVNNDGEQAQFDIITAWEVMEHIQKENVANLFKNIKDHLSNGGYFVASVAQFPDMDVETGTIWHVTLETREWWESEALKAGLKISHPHFMVTDFVRGAGQQVNDWDIRSDPSLGFHMVLQKNI